MIKIWRIWNYLPIFSTFVTIYGCRRRSAKPKGSILRNTRINISRQDWNRFSEISTHLCFFWGGRWIFKTEFLKWLWSFWNQIQLLDISSSGAGRFHLILKVAESVPTENHKIKSKWVHALTKNSVKFHNRRKFRAFSSGRTVALFRCQELENGFWKMKSVWRKPVWETLTCFYPFSAFS